MEKVPFIKKIEFLSPATYITIWFFCRKVRIFKKCFASIGNIKS